MGQGTGRAPFPLEFQADAWGKEVERFAPRTPERQSAERARREIEAGRSHLNLLRCEAEGREGTSRNPRTKSVYQRAHKRLHGRYP